MNRRNFLSSLVTGTAAVMMPATVGAMQPTVVQDMPHVQPANGQRMILGVAARNVRAGDLVEVVHYGPVTVRMK